MKTNFTSVLLAGAIAVSASLGCCVFADDSEDSRADAKKAFEQLTDASVKGLADAAEAAAAKGGVLRPKFRIVSVPIPVVATVSNGAQTSTSTTSTTTSTDSQSATATATNDSQTATATATATNDSQSATATATVTNGSQTSTTTSTTPAQTAPVDDAQIAVKVWFELPDGTCVNPGKKKWGAKEQFYVHVEAAVPVYVALFQNYPESRPTTRQIYPDKNYSDSFKALQPGQGTKLPVLFEMDDDMRDEIVSMVVVRADWEGIQNGLTAQATASVTATNDGAQQVSAQVTTSGVGTLKCVNERMATNKDLSASDAKSLVKGLSDKNAAAVCKAVNGAASLAKFKIVEATKTTSETPDDVCNYMFGAGYVAQWQLTISK